LPGRHAAPAGRSFYRDLLTMLGGIVAVGVIVYLGLSALSTTDGRGSTDTTVAPSTTAAPLTTTTRAITTTTTTAPTTSTSTTVARRAPAEIVVVVLNGVGVAGLAAEVSAGLEELGYQTLEPGNYEPVLSQSLILYSEGFEVEAFELAAEFPDAQVQQDTAGNDEGADIVVVLGESYES
jgi:LytR cell envelope-related transcriptional attenuator